MKQCAEGQTSGAYLVSIDHMNAIPESPHEALARSRATTLQKCTGDPFLGYSAFQDAVDDAKFTSQAEALARLFSGRNIFLSGPAGSGKTFVIERYIEWLDAEFEGRVNVAVTASTGIAAQLLGGKTIHSWSGIGITNKKFKQPEKSEWAARERLENVDVLVIDEVSMLPAYLFTRLDALLKFIRRSKAPFGGVQLIVMGDFLQLPPVGKKGERNNDGDLVDSGFCIRTEAWKNASFRALYLDKVHRAKDPKLKRVLATIAADKVDERTKALVQSRIGVQRDPNKKYMVLFTTNKNVDRYNEDRLAENPNPEQKIAPRYSGLSSHWEKLKKANGISDVLKFKVGATVMLTANLPEGHSNGSLGEVTAISPEGVTVRFNDGGSEFITFKDYNQVEKVVVRTEKRRGKDVEIFDEQIVSTVSAIPLKLGYAISVHKSQGQTFEAVEVDLGFIFAAGLGYVALSRVASLDDLIITSNRIHPDTFRVDPQSLRYAKLTKKAAHNRRQEMVKNMEDSAGYLAELKAASISEEEEAAPIELTETEKTSSESVENPEVADPFASAFVDGAEDDEPQIAIGIDPSWAAEDDDFEEEAVVGFPVGFVSYEQLLTNPHMRANIWEKKVEDRKYRILRSQRSGYNNG